MLGEGVLQKECSYPQVTDSISHLRSRFQRQRRTLSHDERASEVGKRKWAAECPEVGHYVRRFIADFRLQFSTELTESVPTIRSVRDLRLPYETRCLG